MISQREALYVIRDVLDNQRTPVGTEHMTLAERCVAALEEEGAFDCDHWEAMAWEVDLS